MFFLAEPQRCRGDDDMKKVNLFEKVNRLDGDFDAPTDTLEGGFDTPVEGFFKKYVLGVLLPIGIGIYAIKTIVTRFGILFLPRRGAGESWKIELEGTDAVILGVFYASLALYMFSYFFFRHERRWLATQGLSEFVGMLGIGVSLIWLTISLWREMWGF
jgi:hypothetical protein